jgi:hypothetical protein
MRVSLLTDAPKYNLALMKLSAWHKSLGDEVVLGQSIVKADKTYASILFDWNKNKYIADEYGGIQFPTVNLPPHIEYIKPDYSLYDLDFSVGYTFRPCYRRCAFCLVKTLKPPDHRHHSITLFHEETFKKICIMNNNWLLDPKWKHTFLEIWERNLTVMEHGLDLRLVDEEKAEAIKKTKWDGRIHFAWDRMCDERLLIHGLKFIKAYKIESRCYVLAGYDTTWEQDLYRCQILINYNQVPYVMPYKDTGMVTKVKNYINSLDWRHYRDNIMKGFDDWCKGIKPKESKAVKKKEEIDRQNLSLFD